MAGWLPPAPSLSIICNDPLPGGPLVWRPIVVVVAPPSVAEAVSFAIMPVKCVLIMRHGHRFSGSHDPQLTTKGLEQARQVATLLRSEPAIDAIFCSPFIRAIQTAAPLAVARQLPLHVDRGFGEIMPESHGNPLAGLLYDTNHRDSLPHVPAGLVAEDAGSPTPQFPDIEGPEYYRQGDTQQRCRTVTRHRDAILRAIASVQAAGGSTVLVVGHGCSSDFIADALCGDQFPASLHTGKRPSGRSYPLDLALCFLELCVAI